jgi:hypothetical protein
MGILSNSNSAIVSDLFPILVVADVRGAINGDRLSLMNTKPIG